MLILSINMTCVCKGGANLTRTKSGHISFLDVLSASLLSPRMPGKINPWEGGTARSLNIEM